MRNKYALTPGHHRGTPGQGNKVNPLDWRVNTPEMRELYYAWMKHRNQANYRGETYELDFETWVSIWNGNHDQRGRQRHCLVMTRTDMNCGWTAGNTIILTLLEHRRRKKSFFRKMLTH